MSSPPRMALAVAILIAGTAHNAHADGPTKTFDYREATLPNGLRVVTIEDHSCPIVAVHLWYHVGSKDEDPARQGFAHMFEHMMFRGTDRLAAAAHLDYVRKVGGTANASTDFDQTIYTQALPANQLEMVLWMEAERMAFLKIDQAGFDTERKVVEEERRLGLNRPYGTFPEKVLPELFAPHPYRWSPIGKIPDLRAASVAELRAFWTKYYVPNNATLVIVGDVKHADAVATATKAFGWIPRGPEPPRVAAPGRPSQSEARSITIKEDNAPTPVLGVVFRTVPAGHPDSVPLEMLAMILGGGESSRIYRELVAEKGLAVIAMAASGEFEQAGLFGLGAAMAPLGGDAKAVREAIARQVARLREGPVTDLELTKAKNRMLKAQIEQTLTVESKARAIGRAAVIEGDPARANDRLDLIRKVTADDLLRVAREYLAPERATALEVERNLLGALLGRRGSKAEDDAPITAAPETTPPPPGRPGVSRPSDLATTPPVAEPIDFNPTPRLAEKTLANGLRVVVIENHEVPYVTIDLGSRAGAAGEAKVGSASMALPMLTKGTAKHDEAALAEELDTYAITLVGDADMDRSSIRGDCLPEHLGRAFGLLGEVVLTPTFPPKEFDKLKKQFKTALAIASAQAEEQADRAFRRRVFGGRPDFEGHPYARKATGDAKDLDALKADDLARWWAENSDPHSSILIVAGDVTPDRVYALAEETFRAWKSPPASAPRVRPEPLAPAPTHIYLVNRPGVQSQIRVGAVADDRSKPGYAAALVVGDYFGGSFNSRVNDTIRVKKGLTYGASGGFRPRLLGGEFQVRTFSKTESTVEAVKAVLAEIRRLRDEPPGSTELATTKSATLGSYARRHETPHDVAAEVLTLWLNHLPFDDSAKTLAEVARLDPDACAAYVRARVDPDRLVVVVVGDASKLKAGLEAIVPVTVVSPGE